MSISKKERTLSIWIGLAIGITLSSLLFRYALNEKEAKTRQRPGNFEGNTTAQGNSELYVKSAIELAWPVKPLALLRLAAKASQSSSASSVLSPERHRLIGTNERTGEWILQIKDISPSGIRSSLAEFKGLSGLIEQVRLSPWTPEN